MKLLLLQFGAVMANETKCDVKNLKFRSSRNKTEMYQFNTPWYVWTDYTSARCRYGVEKHRYTRLTCEDGEVLEDTRCPQKPHKSVCTKDHIEQGHVPLDFWLQDRAYAFSLKAGHSLSEECWQGYCTYTCEKAGDKVVLKVRAQDTTIEVDAERLLSEDDADRSLASTSVCTNKSRIFERGQDMTDYYTDLSDFSLKSGDSRWDTCNMFKCRIECREKKNKLHLRVLEWEWDSTSETTTTRTTTKAAASKICDNKTKIVNRTPQLEISIGKRFRLAATKTKSGACKEGGTIFKCTLKCLSRNGAVQLLLKKEKVCMFKDLKFEEGNDEDMFQLEHLKQSGVFPPGKKVSVKCNKYSLGTSTQLQCRNGKVVYNEDCLWARLNKNGCPLASNVADADKVDLTKNCTSEDNFRSTADLKCKNGKTIYYYRLLLSEKFATFDGCDSNDA